VVESVLRILTEATDKPHYVSMVESCSSDLSYVPVTVVESVLRILSVVVDTPCYGPVTLGPLF
jgi:hypothetical protein